MTWSRKSQPHAPMIFNPKNHKYHQHYRISCPQGLENQNTKHTYVSRLKYNTPRYPQLLVLLWNIVTHLRGRVSVSPGIPSNLIFNIGGQPLGNLLYQRPDIKHVTRDTIYFNIVGRIHACHNPSSPACGAACTLRPHPDFLTNLHPPISTISFFSRRYTHDRQPPLISSNRLLRHRSRLLSIPWTLYQSTASIGLLPDLSAIVLMVLWLRSTIPLPPAL